MFVAGRPLQLALSATVVAAVSSCGFHEPAADDASAIYGCYRAPNASSFDLGAGGLRIEGAAAPIPFRYEFRKVGYVLNVPLVAHEVAGHFRLLGGDSHFYRVVASGNGPVIVVASAPNNAVLNYTRSTPALCSA
jgi:hypothetical protein